MEEDFETLLSPHPNFFPLTQQTTLQATQSTPDTPTQVATTFYPNRKNPPTPCPIQHQSLLADMTTHDKTFFPRPTTPLFSSTSAGLPLAHLIPQTQLQSHQPQIVTFRPPIPAKITTVKPSTVSIQLRPISRPIIRPKPSIPISSLTANLTKASHSNSP